MSEDTVRLACVKHTASVHPEPGSNSPFYQQSFRPELLLLFTIRTLIYHLRVSFDEDLMCFFWLSNYILFLVQSLGLVVVSSASLTGALLIYLN